MPQDENWIQKRVVGSCSVICLRPTNATCYLLNTTGTEKRIIEATPEIKTASRAEKEIWFPRSLYMNSRVLVSFAHTILNGTLAWYSCSYNAL